MPPEGEAWERFARRLSYIVTDTDGPRTSTAQTGRRRTGRRPAAAAPLPVVPTAAMGPIVTEIGRPGWHADARVIIEKPFGTDLASARELNALLHRCSTRTRSSASTTSSARRRCRTSSPCASRTACSSRSGTATTSSTCRSTCRRRSAIEDARRVLRGHGRLSRHGGDAPVPAARLRGHGAADRARGARARGREDKGLRRDARRSTRGRGAGSVRRLPRRGGRASRLGDRDVRRGAGVDRQLALGRRAVLPADRKADRPRAGAWSRLPSAAAARGCSATRLGASSSDATT